MKKEYKLPDDGNKLHGVINANLNKFETLLRDLEDTKKLKTLKRLLMTKQK